MADNSVQEKGQPGQLVRAALWNPETEQFYGIADAIPVVIAAGDQPLDVHSVDFGQGTVSKAQFHVPAAANYSANDIVSGAATGGQAWHFPNCARANGE